MATAGTTIDAASAATSTARAVETTTAAARPAKTPVTFGGGKHGTYKFRDSSKAKTGTTCNYSGGRLKSVTVTAPLAAGRAYWRRGQYVPWTVKLERRHGKRWQTIAFGQGSDAKPIKAKVLTGRKALTVKTTGSAPAGGVYRVIDKLSWIANLPGGPEEGWVKHVVTHYHYAFGRRVRADCTDAAPKLTPPATQSVIGSATFTMDSPGLLAGATQAQHDPLHVRLLSAKADGKAWPGVKVSRTGGLVVPTQATDIGKAILVRYRAVDSAGRASPVGQVTVNVTNDPPTAQPQTFGPATPGQRFSVAAPGLLTGDLGPDLVVASATNPSFNSAADGFAYRPDGSFSLTPNASSDPTAGKVTFDYTVADSLEKISTPATATVLVAPTATTHTYNATPGQALTVSPAQGLLSAAVGPSLTLGSISGASFDASSDAFTTNANGGFTITPTTSQDSTTQTFNYTVVNADGVASAAQTVTIKVGHLAPVGAADTYSVAGGNVLTGCVLTNDTFYGNLQPQTAELISSVTNSSFWRFTFTSSTGCFSFTAPSGVGHHTVSFTYQPKDTVNGNTTVATISTS